MKIKQRDSPEIAKKVLIAKVFPICLRAKNMKGMFRTNNISDTEIGVRNETSNEIPVIPPSIKPLGIKKLFSPKPATKTPRIRRKDSLIARKLVLRNFFIKTI